MKRGVIGILLLLILVMIIAYGCQPTVKGCCMIFDETGNYTCNPDTTQADCENNTSFGFFPNQSCSDVVHCVTTTSTTTIPTTTTTIDNQTNQTTTSSSIFTTTTVTNQTNQTTTSSSIFTTTTIIQSALTYELQYESSVDLSNANGSSSEPAYVLSIPGGPEDAISLVNENVYSDTIYISKEVPALYYEDLDNKIRKADTFTTNLNQQNIRFK